MNKLTNPLVVIRVIIPHHDDDIDSLWRKVCPDFKISDCVEKLNDFQENDWEEHIDLCTSFEEKIKIFYNQGFQPIQNDTISIVNGSKSKMKVIDIEFAYYDNYDTIVKTYYLSKICN